MLQQNLKLSNANTNQLACGFNISFRIVRRVWDQIKNSIKSGSKKVFFEKDWEKGGKGEDCTALKVPITIVNYKDMKTVQLLQESLQKKRVQKSNIWFI